ncbi:MAG: hypothetical protein WB710_18740 [Stellaceae bacterium]
MAEAGVKPLGERTGLNSDMLDLPAFVANAVRDRSRVAVGLPLLDDHPAFVDRADAQIVQRYVDPDEELHGGVLLERVENSIVGSRDAGGTFSPSC